MSPSTKILSACVIAAFCSNALCQETRNGQRLQEIRIAQPKLWLYDRMYPMLDGLLRDVEGVSVSSLSNLDASQVNTRIIDLLQSYFQASVTADQTAAITNGFALDSFKATRASQLNQMKDQGTAAQALADQKAKLVQSLTQTLDAQSKRIAVLPAGTSCSGDAECKQTQQNVADLNAALTSIQTASTASAPISGIPPSITGVTPPQLTNSTVSSGIDPKGFITTAMTADPTAIGTLPAREKLDSLITLLNERLTRQLSLSLDDDGISGNYVAEIVEFDVSVEPHASRSGQTAASEFQLDLTDTQCGNAKPTAYNLYPSLAAFNVAHVSGRSNGFMVSGAFKGLFIGSSASYQRQKDHVREAMEQSVYVSGYREGQSKFGWFYGPPAYTSMVRPGVYTTFAVLLVPKDSSGRACSVTLRGKSFWKGKNDRIRDLNSAALLTASANIVTSGGDDLTGQPLIQEIQYVPHYGATDVLQNDVNVITVEFKKPINPNLMLTVSGKLLKRVRDWRGRATSPSSNSSVTVTNAAGANEQVSLTRGLFEADINDPDTWIAVSQTKIMIKLAYRTAGSSSFPEIRLLVPGTHDWGLPELLDYNTYGATATIGTQTFLACHPKPDSFKINQNQGCMPQPSSMWLPLFLPVLEQAHTIQILRTAPDAPDNSGMSNQQYVFVTLDDGKTRLSPLAQVTVSGPGHSRFSHPVVLECSSFQPGLLCHFHPQTILFSGVSKEPGKERCLVMQDARGIPVYMPDGDPDRQRASCDWHNYRLELQVIQPANETENRPALFAKASYPADQIEPGPAIGSSQAVAIRQSTALSGGDSAPLQFAFPVYGPSSLAATPRLCVGTENGNIIQAVQSRLEANPSDARMGTLYLDVPSTSLGQLLFATSHLFRARALTCPVSVNPKADDLGVLPGIQDSVIPGGVQLTKLGATSRLYLFTGSNLNYVTQVIASSEPNSPIPVSHLSTGLIADLSQTRFKKDSFLLFAIGATRFPISACSTESQLIQSSSNQSACGPVVVGALAESPKGAPSKPLAAKVPGSGTETAQAPAARLTNKAAAADRSNKIHSSPEP